MRLQSFSFKPKSKPTGWRKHNSTYLPLSPHLPYLVSLVPPTYASKYCVLLNHEVKPSPPSTGRSVPVLKELAGDARKSVAFATSSGVPFCVDGWLWDVAWFSFNLARPSQQHAHQSINTHTHTSQNRHTLAKGCATARLWAYASRSFSFLRAIRSSAPVWMQAGRTPLTRMFRARY